MLQRTAVQQSHEEMDIKRIPQLVDVSPFHLIIWIFMVDQLTEQQKKRIKSIYGVLKDQMSKEQQEGMKIINRVLNDQKYKGQKQLIFKEQGVSMDQIFRKQKELIKRIYGVSVDQMSKEQRERIKTINDASMVQISKEQKELIKRIYGISMDQMSKKQKQSIRRTYEVSKDIFTPKNIDQLENTLQCVSANNQKSVLKIVTNKKYVQDILNIQMDNIERRINDIFVYSNDEMGDTSGILVGTAFQKSFNIGHGQDQISCGIVTDLNKIIQRAERQVEKYTISMRTFNNSQCLIKETIAQTNQYRYKLISLMKLKFSDYESHCDQFQQFAENYLTDLKHNLLKIEKKQKFIAYLKDSKQFMKKQIQIARQSQKLSESQKLQIQRDRTTFFVSVIILYQKEDLFYQLMNTSLRALCDGSLTNWEVLAVPFYQLYSAIKYFFKRQVQRQLTNPSSDIFYTKDFTVYRGGRIRKSQINYYEKYQSKIFIQFFGFTSTTLNPRIAVQKFLLKNLQAGKQNLDDYEKCVFRISAKIKKQMFDPKYDYILHGFYKYLYLLQNGTVQKQVLFGPLNIFKLCNISRIKVKELFTEQQMTSIKKQIDPRQWAYSESFKAYQSQVVLVQLDFGLFFDVLLEDNPYNLSEGEKSAKENYINCMNNIKKYDQFGFADVYQLRKQLSNCYNYLQKKVKAQKKEDQLQISLTDNTNYFAKMSAVCQKLGKNKQALQFNKISIKCHQHLNSINQGNIYNSHYQKYFNMKMKIIQFYQQNSNFIAADLQFEKQRQILSSNKFKDDPKAKLKLSQTIINQGMNNFSTGKIKETITNFKKSQQQIQNVSERIQEDQNNQKTYCCIEYLKNLFCCRKGERFIICCNFYNYFNQQKINKINDLNKRKKEIDETKQKLSDLLIIAMKALQTMKKLFKKQKPYEDLIKKFNSQLTQKLESKRQSNVEPTLNDQIRLIIQKVSNKDISDPEYSDLFNKLVENCKRLKAENNLKLRTQGIQVNDMYAKYVQEFIKKEKQKKIKYEQQTKQQMLKLNQEDLRSFYTDCYQQIDRQLKSLEQDGYVCSATPFLKKLNQRAQILLKRHDNKQALQDVEKILKEAKQQGDYRNYQLAKAYMTKAKICLNVDENQEAIESINCSIKYYERSVQCSQQTSVDRENEHSQHNSGDFNQVYPQPKNKDEIKKINPSEVLMYRNQYLNLKLLKVKSLLNYIYDKIQKGYNKTDLRHSSILIQSKCWKQLSPRELLKQVFDILTSVKDAIKLRNSLQNLNQIQADFKQMNAIYYLIQHCKIKPKQSNVDNVFTMLDQCFSLRNQILGVNNYQNFATCSEIIFKFHYDPSVYFKIQQHDYLKIITHAFNDFKNSYFYWKVVKAYYLMSRVQKDQSIQYLKIAISYLKDDKDKYLVKERLKLEQELNCWTNNMLSTTIKVLKSRNKLQQNNSAISLPFNSVVPQNRNSQQQLKQSINNRQSASIAPFSPNRQQLIRQTQQNIQNQGLTTSRYFYEPTSSLVYLKQKEQESPNKLNIINKRQQKDEISPTLNYLPKICESQLIVSPRIDPRLIKNPIPNEDTDDSQFKIVRTRYSRRLKLESLYRNNLNLNSTKPKQ